MPVNAIQPSFAGGEIARALYNRIDLQRRAISCKTLRNFMVHPSGKASNRPGSYFVKATKNSAKRSRLIPFEYSTEQAYVIEFGDLYCRFYKDGGQIVIAAASLDDFNPAQAYSIGYYSKVGPYLERDFGGGKKLYIAAPYGLTAANTVKVATQTNTGDTLALTAAGDTITIKLANATGSKNAANLIQTALRALGTVNGVSVAAWTVTENAAYAAARPITGTIAAELLGAHAVLYQCLAAIPASDYNTSVLPPSDAAVWAVVTAGEPVEIVSPFAEADLFLLKFTQSADVLYITRAGYKPRTLTRRNHYNWTMADFGFVMGPFRIANTDKNKHVTPSGKTGGIAVTSDFDLFDSLHIGALFQISHSIEAQTASGGYTAVGTNWSMTRSLTGTQTGATSNIYCSGDWTFVLSGTWVGTVKLQQSTDGGDTWSDIDTYTTNGTRTGTVTTPCLLRMNCTAHASGTITGVLTAEQEMACQGSWRLTTHGTWKAKFHLERSLDGGSTWNVYHTYTGVNDKNWDVTGEEENACLLRLRCYEYTSGTLNIDLSIDTYTHRGIVQIATVTNARSATATVIESLALTDATDDWAEGSWSNYRGYPGAVGFYGSGDRFCLAGNTAEPQGVLMSQTSDYTGFGVSDPLVDTDRIAISLPSRKVSAVKHLVDLGKLIAFTGDATWKIGPGDNQVVAPSTVNPEMQEGYGSSDAAPIVVGERVIYVQPQGSIVRDTGYSFEANKYIGNNISIFASHLVDGYQITEIAYQKEPNSIVWFARDDGKLLGLTYVPEQQIWAWHRHDTDGEYESACVIPADGYDELWVIVKRTIGGVPKRYIERFAQRMPSTEIEDQFFVDCGLSYSGAPATEFSGLSHLEGKEVSILADGVVVARQTVASGKITLTNSASKVHVGLPYVSDLEPVAVEFETPTGILQAQLTQIPLAFFDLENTKGGWAGPDSNSLYELLNMGTVGELYTGLFEQSLASGCTRGATVFFRQIDPLPVTILAIMPNVNPGG